MAQPWRVWDGTWMAFGLLPQMYWAKCSLGEPMAVIIRLGNSPERLAYPEAHRTRKYRGAYPTSR